MSRTVSDSGIAQTQPLYDGTDNPNNPVVIIKDVDEG